MTPAWVRKLRSKTGLSKMAFARSVGCNASSIARWETGKLKPGDKYAPRLLELAAEHNVAPPPEPKWTTDLEKELEAEMARIGL